jgi:excisionase family DNA binding protein
MSESLTLTQNPDILTAKEVAAYLKIPLPTVYYLVQRKKLPCFPVGGRKRFHRHEIEKIAAQGLNPDQSDSSDQSEVSQDTASIAMFTQLCSYLIDKGYCWLYPIIYRRRSTDWVAEIHTHTLDDSKSQLLATGQAETMPEACRAAVFNYQENQKINTRKEQLLSDPTVQEAFNLFGFNKLIA